MRLEAPKLPSAELQAATPIGVCLASNVPGRSPKCPAVQDSKMVPKMGRIHPLRRSISLNNYLHAGRGGAKGNRTPDLLNAIQALSQLSYGPGRRSL